MSDNNPKLGRGLSALLGEERKLNSQRIRMSNIGKGFTVYQIPTDKIIAGIYQPRSKFNDQTIEELSNSIKEYGIIQPIIIRKANKDQNIYEIISGERRFRAAKLLNLKEVPAIIRDIENDQALAIGILENIQREDLSILEEATSYKQLIEEFNYSQQDIAQKIGKSRSHIANLLRLLSLPIEVQSMINDKLLTMGHAKVIMNRQDIIEIAHKIIADSLSVRQTEELCSNTKENALPKSNLPKKININPQEYNKKIQYISDKLGNLMGDAVKIKSSFNANKNSGKITISYQDLDKMIKLLNKISPNM